MTPKRPVWERVVYKEQHKAKMPRKEYRPKEQPSITIGTARVPIGATITRPIVIGESATKNIARVGDVQV